DNVLGFELVSECELEVYGELGTLEVKGDVVEQINITNN
ncbi:unnamed protein product, partial [Brachionus calyciflorus]